MEWNEQTVKELLSFIHQEKPICDLLAGYSCLENPSIAPRDHILEQFKKKKAMEAVNAVFQTGCWPHIKIEEPKKGYEILSFKCDGFIVAKQEDGTFGSYETEEPTFINSPLHKIHSVKRLSDGEIFTVGDFCLQGAIKRISISDWTKELYFDFENGETGCTMRLVDLKKAPQYSFITADGVLIKDGEQKLFAVLTKAQWETKTDTLKRMSERSHVSPLNSAWKYFSTEAAREEYILVNKPLISLEDMRTFLDKYFGCVWVNMEELKPLAKSKLTAR